MYNMTYDNTIINIMRIIVLYTSMYTMYMYMRLPEIAPVLPQDIELPSLVLYPYIYCSGIQYVSDTRNHGTDAI